MSRTIVRGSWVDRGYVEFDLHFRFVLFCRSFFFYSEDLFSDMIILLIIAMQWPFASCRKSMLQMVGRGQDPPSFTECTLCFLIWHIT